jgi:hypothetical protein
MTKTTLLATGSWIFGLLVGAYAWLSPDSPWFPSPGFGAALVAGAVLILLAGAFVSGIRRDTPKPPWTAHVAALGPTVAAALALILAARGLLPHPILPLIFILLFGVAGHLLLRGRGTAPMSIVGDVGTALLLIAAMLVVLPALGLAAGGQLFWQLATPDLTRATARIESTRGLDALRPASRGAIPPEEVGMAVQAIAATGAERDTQMLEAAGTSGAPWLPDTGRFAGWPGDSVMRYALRGLTGEERAWLARAVAHPGRGLIDTVAYAASFDPWAALRLPLSATMTGPELPLPRFFPLRNAARARLYAAALAATSNRHAEADSLIRSVIGFGLRLRDDSDLLIGTLIGTSIAREAGSTLAAHWRAQGRILMADSLEASLALPMVTRPDSATEPLSPRVLRAQMLAGAVDRDHGRSLRWENLSMLGLAQCTDLHENLYGPSPAIRKAFIAAALDYRATPGSRAAFEALGRGVTGMGASGSTPLFLRPAAWALGENGAHCARAMFGMGRFY